MPNWLIQAIIIEFFLIITIFRSSKIFPKIRNDEEIRNDFFNRLSIWNGDIDNFIEFKKYEYSQEFWFTFFEFTFSMFLAGLFISLNESLIGILGFYAFITFIGCLVYFISRFAVSLIPNAHKNAKTNIKFLLEEKPKIGLTLEEYQKLYKS